MGIELALTTNKMDDQQHDLPLVTSREFRIVVDHPWSFGLKRHVR